MYLGYISESIFWNHKIKKHASLSILFVFSFNVWISFSLLMFLKITKQVWINEMNEMNE